MLLGYVRVSKSDGSQNLDLQKDALEAYGVEKENIYSDYASGKLDDRPDLQACLKALRTMVFLMFVNHNLENQLKWLLLQL